MLVNNDNIILLNIKLIYK